MSAETIASRRLSLSVRAAIICPVLLSLLAAAAAAGVVPPPFELSLTTVGARSLGFGGAFAARADDATIASSNPAGLSQLLRPEVSVEIRQVYHKGSSGSWSPFGEMTSLGFVSAVYPAQRWSIAGYFNRSARSMVVVETSEPEYAINSYGVAVAYRLTDSLSIGVGYALLEENAEAGFLDDLLGDTSIQTGATGDQRSRKDAPGYNAGFLWRATQQWNVGGFYRQGPELELTLPDVYGLGVSYRSGDGDLILAFEWDRIEYSTLLSSFDPRYFDVSRLVLDDADELHLGAELVWLKESPIKAFRCGLWLDPYHQTRAIDEPRGDDEIHLALGFGLAWDRVQLDFGFDTCDSDTTGSVAVIFNF